ncbi:hypothetical protein [Streptomyces sp. NBC_01198]|uniref:hypothetical protein n=1 Tax=Streptomyces sp. NBC_01198 TaxID=2903769 RepID=UPI002E0DE796|nr:hypothetical protein OG702_06965 [Streptomyces sp. NBC_01198]
MTQEVLRHLSSPHDAPDGRGVARTGPGGRAGYYFWETADARMCFAETGPFPDIAVTCGGPSAAERDHMPELRPLFGPASDPAGGWYLIFRLGHGTVISSTLEGNPVTAQRVRKLGPQVGGGQAYFIPLPHWPHDERLSVKVAVNGKQKTLTMNVDL